ncbi:hypothetical protein AB3M74_23435 (plasmid) [Serratia ureilytica]|uniref:hypothetical protein n=1 Tax=Serratia ureilytica TaxID=300181 RepID=UPI003717A1CE
MLCQTFDVHRSSYRHWQASANEPDGERVVKLSQVMEAWNASGGSAGARSIATIVSRDSGVNATIFDRFSPFLMSAIHQPG